MNTENTNRFLDAFAEIERYLRLLCNAEKYTTFSWLVDDASHKNAAVKTFRDDLREYAELRNALVHGRGRYGIAEPYPATVSHIENIQKLLLEPPKIIPEFQKQVTELNPSHDVGRAAMWMRDKNFSQIPVYENGRLYALLTAETIARWLGATLEDGGGIIIESPIAEVLKHSEDPENYTFLPRSATIFDALNTFDSSARSGKTLVAIIISHSGKPTEKPLGILTASDIPRLRELARET